MAAENKSVLSKTSNIVIGETTYIVTCTFNENARETAGQKFLKLVTERVADEIKTSKRAVI